MIGNGVLITPGNVAQPAGSGGGASTDILTNQTINNGSTTLTHTLGEQPDTVLFFKSTGEPLMLAWTPTTGNETTQIDVTNGMPQFTGVTVQLAASA